MCRSTNPSRDLVGKRFGRWYVVSFAGRRDGVNYWQCQCCVHIVERILSEPDLQSRKAEPQLKKSCGCFQEEGALEGYIFGLWTVIELADPAEPTAPKGAILRSWSCRCACGTNRTLDEQDLLRFMPLSCGCRPENELRFEWWTRCRRAQASFRKAVDELRRRERDRKWSRDMEKALRRFQPACVLCGATDDLTTHHVRPLSRGHGLEPGNAVRLCRGCNSFVHNRNSSELTPGQAGALEAAAAEFKRFWRSGCASALECAAPSALETPVPPDTAFVGLLRAVERGDEGAVAALATWLDQRGDSRAQGIARLAGAKERVSERLWELLGLSWSQRDTVKGYLGINPEAVPLTVGELALRMGKRPQTIRHTLDLGLYRMLVGKARGSGRR